MNEPIPSISSLNDEIKMIEYGMRWLRSYWRTLMGVCCLRKKIIYINRFYEKNLFSHKLD